MNLKKSFISITIASVVFGVTYKPIEEVTKSPSSFIAGFSWGSIAAASETCETSRDCDVERIPVYGDPYPYFPPDFPYYPPEVDCDYEACGGGQVNPPPSNGEPDPEEEAVSVDDAVSMVEALLKFKTYLNGFLTSHKLDAASRVKIIELMQQVDNFMTAFAFAAKQGDGISHGEFADIIASMGSDLASIIVGGTTGAVTVASLAAILGTAPASVPTIIVGFVANFVGSWVFDVLAGEALEDELARLIEDALNIDLTTGVNFAPLDLHDPATDYYCRMREVFQVPCIRR